MQFDRLTLTALLFTTAIVASLLAPWQSSFEVSLGPDGARVAVHGGGSGIGSPEGGVLGAAGAVVGRARFVPAASSCPNAAHTPGGPDGFGGCWPYAGNTGIPAGTSLSTYSGSCMVTTNSTAFTAKTINCDPLTIAATGVTITNSKINGSVLIDSPPNPAYSFTITDSEVDVGDISPGDEDSGIGEANFTATRVHVYNGRRSIWCENDCTVTDSYMHGQATDETGAAHEAAVRQGDGSTLIHNSILCNAPDVPPDAGCSADLTGYGDFAPIQNNLVYRNLFLATTGGFCAYGGSSGDDGSKPFGGDAANIVFQDNIFQRGGPGGTCGFFGAITDFNDTRPGNVWTNNKYDDGTTLPPAN